MPRGLANTLKRPGAALAVGFVVLSVACGKFEFPSGTCRGVVLNAAAETASQPLQACTDCLELAPSCDAVGRCNDDVSNTCIPRVKAMHRCMLESGVRGAEQERQCEASNLVDELSKSTYETMRTNCGAECGLQVCRVESAVAQLGSPACDKCITGACCGTINTCYANRTCKLILECIAKCPDPFEVVGGGVDPCAAPDAATGPPPPDDAPGCIGSCIRQFQEHEQLRPDNPANSAACLSFSIQACARAANCQSACAPPPVAEAGTDASGTASDAAPSD